MSSERPLQPRKAIENDAINLAVTALHHGFAMFAERQEDGRRVGFDLLTQEPGIPEHLLMLIAAFAKDVPKTDLRFESTIESLKSYLHREDEAYLLETQLDGEEQALYGRNLADIYCAIEDPFEIQGVVEMMLASKAENGFERRAWKKAFRFNSFDDSAPQLGDKVPGAPLADLDPILALLEADGAAPVRAEHVRVAVPEQKTVPPPRGGKPGWKLKYGRGAGSEPAE